MIMYINRKIVMGKTMFIGIMILICTLLLIAINSKIATNQFIETYTEKIPAMEQKIAELEKQNAELNETVLGLQDTNEEYELAIAELESQIAENIIIADATEELDVEDTEDIVEEDPIIISDTQSNPALYASNKALDIKILAKNEQKKKEAISLEEEVAITSDDEPEVINVNLTDITQKSNLTTEQFNMLISNVMNEYGKTNSDMINTGEYLKFIEDTYNINGLFALSVASLESGWGQRHPNNNLFGFGSGSIYFESDGESINYFGRLIRESYIDIGLTNIESISRKYCPPNSNKWTKDVYWFMSIYETEANNILIE